MYGCQILFLGWRMLKKSSYRIFLSVVGSSIQSSFYKFLPEKFFPKIWNANFLFVNWNWTSQFHFDKISSTYFGFSVKLLKLREKNYIIIYIYIYIYTLLYIYIHLCICIYTCLWKHKNTPTHMLTYIQIYVCT